MTTLLFETHSWSEDNELGLASGWRGGALAPRGRGLAAALGDRRRHDGLAAVFCSDLVRAVETTQLAFAGSDIPILLDWRLRECDFGDWTGRPAADFQDTRLRFLDAPYPNGESWRQAIQRVGRFLPDLHPRWTGARVLVIGHTATRWAFDHFLRGQPLEALLAAPFDWQEGWEYTVA